MLSFYIYIIRLLTSSSDHSLLSGTGDAAAQKQGQKYTEYLNRKMERDRGGGGKDEERDLVNYLVYVSLI